MRLKRRRRGQRRGRADRSRAGQERGAGGAFPIHSQAATPAVGQLWVIEQHPGEGEYPVKQRPIDPPGRCGCLSPVVH